MSGRDSRRHHSSSRDVSPQPSQRSPHHNEDERLSVSRREPLRPPGNDRHRDHPSSRSDSPGMYLARREDRTLPSLPSLVLPDIYSQSRWAGSSREPPLSTRNTPQQPATTQPSSRPAAHDVQHSATHRSAQHTSISYDQARSDLRPAYGGQQQLQATHGAATYPYAPANQGAPQAPTYRRTHASLSEVPPSRHRGGGFSGFPPRPPRSTDRTPAPHQGSGGISVFEGPPGPAPTVGAVTQAFGQVALTAPVSAPAPEPFPNVEGEIPEPLTDYEEGRLTNLRGKRNKNTATQAENLELDRLLKKKGDWKGYQDILRWHQIEATKERKPQEKSAPKRQQIEPAQRKILAARKAEEMSTSERPSFQAIQSEISKVRRTEEELLDTLLSQDFSTTWKESDRRRLEGLRSKRKNVRPLTEIENEELQALEMQQCLHNLTKLKEKAQTKALTGHDLGQLAELMEQRAALAQALDQRLRAQEKLLEILLSLDVSKWHDVDNNLWKALRRKKTKRPLTESEKKELDALDRQKCDHDLAKLKEKAQTKTLTGHELNQLRDLLRQRAQWVTDMPDITRLLDPSSLAAATRDLSPKADERGSPTASRSAPPGYETASRNTGLDINLADAVVHGWDHAVEEAERRHYARTGLPPPLPPPPMPTDAIPRGSSHQEPSRSRGQNPSQHEQPRRRRLREPDSPPEHEPAPSRSSGHKSDPKKHKKR